MTKPFHSSSAIWRRCLQTTLATLTIAHSLGTAFADAGPVIQLGELPLLFPDDANLLSSKGVDRVVHQATTLREPVVKADQPWEKGRVYLYGNVVIDPASQQFAMWYSTPKPSSVLYATSRDGITWEKPALSLFTGTEGGSGNIVFEGVHSPSVLFDAAEADPKKRFKMMAKGSKGYLTAASPDGIHWKENPKSKSLPKGDDTLVLSFDPRTGDYLCYYKELETIRGFKRRIVYLSRSKDFLNWSEPELVFAPDEEDDAWAGDGQRTEVYNMSVYPHAGGLLGFPTMFHVTASRKRTELSPNQSPDDGTIDVQLATSGDGSRWSRVIPRTNVIPRGALGTFDQGAILGLATQLVHSGDKTWIYYTGVSTTHGAPVPPKEIAIGRAEWRRDGFVSLDASPEEASIETALLRLTHPTLIINANASQGAIRVALRETDGSPISGYDLADCVPLTKDGTSQPVQWKSQPKAPTDRPVRVLIEMSRGARLYSLSSAKEGAEAKSP